MIDPVALNELIPDWKEKGAPLNTPVTEDRFFVLGPQGAMRLPNALMPPLMDNHGNYAVSLGNVCRWLAQQAEASGVEIYPGFACSEVLYREDGSVRGVVAGVMGIGKDGMPKPDFQPGMELLGKYVFIAEGVRGSLAKEIIARFNLSEGREPQKFGLGMKELWEVRRRTTARARSPTPWAGRSAPRPAAAASCTTSRTIWSRSASSCTSTTTIRIFPLHGIPALQAPPADRAGAEGRPPHRLWRARHHRGRLPVGAETLFPGGALIGCSAGFVNVPRIKGSHNAMKTGMLAAEAAVAAHRRRAARRRASRI